MNIITIIPLESVSLLTGLVIIAVVGITLGYWLARFRQGFGETCPKIKRLNFSEV